MNKRYFFFAGTFLITLLLYVDRVAISTSKDSIAGALALTDKEVGWVLAAFSLGYALFQVPVGALGDRFGPRKVLAGIISLWSLFTVLTGAAGNYLTMLLARFAFGAGEAGAFPNISRAAYSWVPLSERGIFQGINFSGSRLGAAFALPAIAALLNLMGWRNVFFLLGAIGIFVALLFWVWFRDKPEEHKGISQQECDLIAGNRDDAKNRPLRDFSWGSAFQNKNIWLLMVQYIGSNFIFFFTLTWLFPYLKSQYELGLVAAGFWSMLPLLAGAAGNWVSGYWVDYLYRKGKTNVSRSLPAMTGFVLVALGVLGSMFQGEIAGAVFFLSLAIFGADMTLSPSWAFCIDIGHEHAGKVSGLMNMAGNLGAFITALAFPYLQAWTGSNSPFFITAAVLGGIGVLAWWRMDSRKTLFNEKAG